MSLWSTPQIFPKQYSIQNHNPIDDDLIIEIPETLDDSQDSSFNQTTNALVNIIASIMFVQVFISTLNPVLPEPMYIRATVYLFLGMFSFILVNIFSPTKQSTTSTSIKNFKISLNAYINRQLSKSVYNNIFLSIPPFFCYYAVDGYQQLLMPHMNASILWQWMAVIVVFIIFFILQYMNNVRRSREMFETAKLTAAKEKLDKQQEKPVILSDRKFD